jgi:hypothetical protein
MPSGTDSQVLVSHTYAAYFSYPSGMPGPDVDCPKSFTVLGYTITLIAWTNDYANTQRIMRFRIESYQNAPGIEIQADNEATAVTASNGIQFVPLAVPISVLALALLAVLGVAALYLTLTKVEEIVDSPAGGALSIGLLVLAGLAAFYFLKKT